LNPALVFLVAAAIGFASGLRAFTPLALVGWLAVWGWIPLSGSRLWFLGTPTGAIIVSVLALGELIGDKLPKTPPRIAAGPLVARVLTGALSATAISLVGGEPRIIGLLAGAIGGVAGAFAGYYTRHTLVRRLRLPDLVVALAEDFLTIGGTLGLLAYLFSKPL
jgi:uncharacterized membrane protein